MSGRPGGRASSLLAARPGLSHLERALGALSAFLIGAMTLLITFDVSGRLLLNKPLQGALEVSEFMMVGIVFLAISYCQMQKAHIRLGMLVDRSRGKVRSLFNLLALLTGLVVMVLITWRGHLEAWEAWQDGYVTQGIPPIPTAPALFLVPLGGLVASLRFALDIWRELRSFGRPAD